MVIPDTRIAVLRGRELDDFLVLMDSVQKLRDSGQLDVLRIRTGPAGISLAVDRGAFTSPCGRGADHTGW